MVVVDLSGNRVAGHRHPSSEIGMHLMIYRLRPDIEAVVHAHPYVATGFAAAGMGLTEPVCSELVLTLGQVPLAPYAQPGTAELSEALRPFISAHDAILMESHGVVTYGRDLEKAYLNMEAVEHCSRIMLVTKLLNTGKSLSRRDVDQLLSVRRQAGPVH
jgi:L-fuculose-phosphate aldolase